MAIISVLMIADVARVSSFINPVPAEFSDTQGYTQMAGVIQNAFANHFDNGLPGNIGARPPVYPLVLVLLQQDLSRVVILQAILGILLSVFITMLTWRLTRHFGVSVIIGLFPALNLAQIFFEKAIMSEIIVSSLFVGCVALLGIFDRPENTVGYDRFFAAGLTAALCLLTRPAFLFLAPAGFITAFLMEINWKKKVVKGILFLFPMLLAFVGWSWVNSLNTGRFAFSTITGYNLVNHTGAFFEDLPEEEAVIRDIYLQYRAQRIEESGTQSMTIWRAFEPLVQATGYNYFTLSQKLTQLSVDLIVTHPLKYMISVGKAWVGFWKVPMYWQPEQINPPMFRRILQVLWWIQKYAQIVFNIAFLLISAFLGSKAIRKSLSARQKKLLMLAIIILSASALQALAEFGENPRYGFPLQTMTVWLVVIFFWDFLSNTENAIYLRLTKRSKASMSAD